MFHANSKQQLIQQENQRKTTKHLLITMSWSMSRYTQLIRLCITRDTKVSSLVADFGRTLLLPPAHDEIEVLRLFRRSTHTHIHTSWNAFRGSFKCHEVWFSLQSAGARRLDFSGANKQVHRVLPTTAVCSAYCNQVTLHSVSSKAPRRCPNFDRIFCKRAKSYQKLILGSARMF